MEILPRCGIGVRDYLLAAFFYCHPRAGGDPEVAYRPQRKGLFHAKTEKIDSRLRGNDKAGGRPFSEQLETNLAYWNSPYLINSLFII
jgi:hypothetical protein